MELALGRLVYDNHRLDRVVGKALDMAVGMVVDIGGCNVRQDSSCLWGKGKNFLPNLLNFWGLHNHRPNLNFDCRLEQSRCS